MPSRIRKCCVPGCNDDVSKRHRFPKSNPILFKRWIEIIKPLNWQNLTDDQIYGRYYVCHAHFSEAHSLPEFRRGLTVDAFPTINVPDQPTYSGAINVEENISDTSVYFDEPTCSNAMLVTEEEALKDGDQWNVIDPNSGQEDVFSDVTKTKRKKINPKSSHGILKQLKCSRISQLTKRERILYNLLRKTNMVMSKMANRNKNYQERLRCAENILQLEGFDKLTKYKQRLQTTPRSCRHCGINIIPG